VAESSGDVAVGYISVEVAHFAAADGFYKVCLVACSAIAFELPDFFAVVVEGPASASSADKIALFALDYVS